MREKKCTSRIWYSLILLLLVSCSNKNPVVPEIPDPVDEIYKLPIVIHIVHTGESIGEGHNLSLEQVESQIRILNEDFRRKEGTRGYNEHPDGADPRVEFVLAKTDPEGNATNGIIRINAYDYGEQIKFHDFEYYASLSYWNPEHYINIWTEPFPEDLTGILLGKATGPDTDLPGSYLFLKGEPEYREGILINSAHFGESPIPSDYDLGRTLTHEMGHYLGVLHPWGTGDCETNDFCKDTPAVDKANGSSCNGEPVMVGNFMNYAPDRLLSIFTNDQASRMHYVIQNSPYRNSLLNSPGLH